MQLYLIRHAESENNARPGHLRVEDPAITATGQLQAKHLAQWLTTLRFDLLVTSPFLRTLQTTRAVLEQSRCTTEIWHDVFERGGATVAMAMMHAKGARPRLGRTSKTYARSHN